MSGKKRIAIVGAGAAGLFLLKNIVSSDNTSLKIDIFEAGEWLGAGMPYSTAGSNIEHVTNVSANEIPDLPTTFENWIRTIPKEELRNYPIDQEHFNPYKVIPRLLFGRYLSSQFELLLKRAAERGIVIDVHLETSVEDIIDDPDNYCVTIRTRPAADIDFNHVIIATGHRWPTTFEKIVPGYFDSPYPPSKLSCNFDCNVAIKGSSLTAIDAITALAKCNGVFVRGAKLSYRRNKISSNFRIVAHSLHGLLPAVRFNLEDPLLSRLPSMLTDDQIALHMEKNGGFLSLDFIFEKDFKDVIRTKDADLYATIREMNLEEFVEMIMNARERAEPFELLKREYMEATDSINRKKSIYWKELLAILSFVINRPAKHFSAEDMLRHKKTLMPLISVIIAFLPQQSCEQLIALHEAGVLEIVSAKPDDTNNPAETEGVVFHYHDRSDKPVATHYKIFIDCTGQQHLSLHEFPFKSLVASGTVTQAYLRFQSPAAAKDMLAKGEEKIQEETPDDFYLSIPGLAINDNFMVIGKDGNPNDRVYLMAVPYIGGYNPDYSGLDFCEEASCIISKSILSDISSQ